MPKMDMPPLARFSNLEDYVPAYGDVVIWAGWLTTWIGVVSDFDRDTNTLQIVFNGVPYVLFTLRPEEYVQHMRKISMTDIRGATKGVWAIQKHDTQRNTVVWYV